MPHVDGARSCSHEPTALCLGARATQLPGPPHGGVQSGLGTSKAILTRGTYSAIKAPRRLHHAMIMTTYNIYKQASTTSSRQAKASKQAYATCNHHHDKDYSPRPVWSKGRHPIGTPLPAPQVSTTALVPRSLHPQGNKGSLTPLFSSILLKIIGLKNQSD